METLVLELTDAENRRIKSLASSAGVSVHDLVISKVLGADNLVTDETAYLLSSPAMEKRLLGAMQEPAEQRKSFSNTEDAAHALGV
jgi:uncharacterized protein (DUF1778 family)